MPPIEKNGGTAMQANAIVQKVREELTLYPGVRAEVREGGKHKRMVFHRNGESRFLTIPRTPSDWRAGDNALRDFRKTMTELGAKRLERTTSRRGKYAKPKGGIFLSLNANKFTFNVGAESKLIDRFKTPDNKAAGHWTFELRASPDLEAPPMIAAKRVELRPGVKAQHGATTGFFNKKTGAWRIALSRSGFPALSKKVKGFARVSAELYEDKGDELVFKLPPGTIPTSFKKPVTPIDPAKVEALTTLEESGLLDEPPAPAPAPIAARAAPAKASEPAPALAQKLTLEFPKQPVSVEAAIGVLNKAKQRLGNNLRFTITEGGFLTATHRIGH
jgi:hypothetical protein